MKDSRQVCCEHFSLWLANLLRENIHLCLIYCQMSFHVWDICVLINFTPAGELNSAESDGAKSAGDHRSEGALDVRI